MFKRIRRAWFKARALSVLQTYYEQPIKNPLSHDDELQLNNAVDAATTQNGTPFDAATIFYISLARQVVADGKGLDDIGFYTFLGRFWSVRDRSALYDQHLTALKSLGNQSA